MAGSQHEIYTIFCLVVGDKSPFPVKIANNETVGILKEMIKEKNHKTFADIEAHKLKLYHVELPVKNLAENVAKLALESQSTLDDPTMPLEEAFPHDLNARMVHILVSPPQGSEPFTGHPRTDYEVALTFKLPTVKSYKNLGSANALELNSITELTGDTPSFISEFQKALKSKRFIPPQALTLAVLQTTLGDQFDSFFTIGSEALGPITTESEILHHLGVLGIGALHNHNKDIFNDAKEIYIGALLLPLSTLVRAGPMSGNLRYDTAWCLSLVVELMETNDKRIYTPRSDAELRFSDFPYLILEVISNHDKSDRVRMLLQASCLARFGNRLRAVKDNPFIASAVYIDNNLRAEWYQVYQNDPSEIAVTYSTVTFDLGHPPEAFNFVFQLYNFIHCVSSGRFNLDPQGNVQRAKAEIDKRHLPSLTTQKRKTEDDGSHGGKRQHTGTEGHGGVFSNPSVTATLAVAGYHVTPDPEPGWAMLDPIGSSMHRATSSSGPDVFLKLLKGSKELEILQYLCAIKSGQNHTISLLNYLALDVGTIIVLPWQSPLPTVLRYRRFPLAIGSLRTQFLEGVAFMHQHGIAHLDLKPDNVVVQGEDQSTSPRLSIVDFDVSERVTGVETLLKGRCGTRGWMAPEVEADGGKYSAILADRWACGKMIQYFSGFMTSGAGDERMAMFARLLLSADPASRPPVNEAVDLTTHGYKTRKRPSTAVPLKYPELQKRRTQVGRMR